MAAETAKKTATFIIYGRLSGLNEYTRACRTNKYAGAKLKKHNEDKVVTGLLIAGLHPAMFTGCKVHMSYKWYEENKRRDLDNIAFAKKFIQDALVSNGVLGGDSWQHITGFTDEFFTDKNNPRIEVTISEV